MLNPALLHPIHSPCAAAEYGTRFAVAEPWCSLTPCVLLPLPVPLIPAAEYSTRFAGQIKDFNSDGLVVKKWDKRIDNVMR